MKNNHFFLAALLLTSALLASCNSPSEAIPSNPDVSADESSLVSSDASLIDASSDAYVVPEIDLHPYDFTVAFVGDVNLSYDWDIYNHLAAVDFDLTQCIDPGVLSELRDANILVINNEFTFSNQGSPMAGKLYTFEADPSLVSILKEIGVDAACLANNHAYDYGEISLIDTMKHLSENDIPYFGAGHDITEATQPLYLTIQGRTVALCAASRAEKYQLTPQATEESAGILRCYDNSLFLDEISTARENADFVLAYVHWGTEFTDVLEDVQVETAPEYIAAGADAVIGAHPHVLQGFSSYDGKPIAYSLGNFWFNGQYQYTCIYKLHFYGDDVNAYVDYSLYPCRQAGAKVVDITDDEASELYTYLDSLSNNASVSDGQVFIP